MGDAPFRIDLYAKDFSWLGELDDPQAVTVTPRHNAQSTAQVVVASDNRYLDEMADSGARMVIQYLPDPKQTLSGVVSSVDAEGTLPGESGQASDGIATLQVRGDYGVLWDGLGWPVPTVGKDADGPLPSQTAQTYWRMDAPAETVLKSVVQANLVDRLGLPIVCAPDQGRGANLSAKWRFHPLGDRLFPAWDDSGLGISAEQHDGHLVLDVYEPGTFSTIITPESGIVTAWGWSWSMPEATRTIAGGQDATENDHATREFTQSVGSDSETEWGWIRETFTDARDVDAGDAAGLLDRALQARLEGRSKAGLSLTLDETATFKYGTDIRVGDTVTETLSGRQRTHQLSECTINWSLDDGLTVAPAVGDLSLVGYARWEFSRGIRRLVRDRSARQYAEMLARFAKKLRDKGTQP